MTQDGERDIQRNAALREGMGKQLRFLQDIPRDQRTQRHTMQIEYFILADKSVETVQTAASAMGQGEPLHVTAAKLGDPVAYHAMLARMKFLCQVSLFIRDLFQ